MNHWTLAKKLTLSLTLTASVAVFAYGCLPLQEAIDQQLSGGNPVLGINPVGPAGQFAFSVRGLDPKSSPTDTGTTTIEVKNSDGSFSPCQYVKEESVDGSEYNSLGLLIDDSGSMGNTYPVDEYGPICTTCPHDPGRKRVEACRELISTVLQNAPESRIAVMVFGPEPDAGRIATKVLADFSTNTDSLIESLQGIDGTQMVGTPLWDSLAENVSATDEDAKDLEGVLQTKGIKTEEGQPVEVKRVLLVLSDGDDRDSVQYNLDDVIRLATEAGVIIHAIGLGPASAAKNPALQTEPTLVEEQIETVQNLQKLAEGTGGFYASVNDASALKELYTAIANGLTNGYAKETWTCLPDGQEPRPGQRVEGRIVDENGRVVSEWSTITPKE